MNIITLGRLNRALSQVQTELRTLGFWDQHLEDVEVYLVPFGKDYGWQYYGSSGEICIPAISFQRLLDAFGGLRFFAGYPEA